MYRIFFVSVAAAALAAGTAGAVQPDRGRSPDAPGHDRVCLVSWPSSDMSGGTSTATSGRYLPRRAAEQQARNSGGRSQAVDISPGMSDQERAACEALRFTMPGGAEPDMVCLVTWPTVDAANTQSNALATDGRYLTRAQAEALAAQSGGVSRVYDYSGRTVDDAGQQIQIDNNAEERAFCEGPAFNPELRR